jgi:ABC-type dipeptide/oligopeptide/nickel transport system ATPase component
MASIPSTHAKGTRLQTIPGLPPTLREPVSACTFRPRNTIGDPALCLTDRIPELIESTPGHFVRNCPGCLK